ncbi:LLM class flavin-dependent oxidoreductase [Amycolatopsis acidicola]|uniref:LLM class flavin-dependent oxidoreductase n=1 Tax=Amycolatopsis acidicola TaxID=2596893 RepID=A0A5N0UQW2_9PSEU|nr:LLM class flavin-dependent oxidoreductase [Amycolatopsis acidicola]KAA9153468.1 LLM class flavin-dependent oxidoreductase [Amycolatopsis acidicola]
MGAEFGIYLPPVALGFDAILAKALDCERLGYHSLWLYDHLYPPGLPEVPSFEAWTLATALLARTTTLRVGHLVTSNTFRHPALLAKMATSVDVLSGGRLEFGIGSGSHEEEHRRAGLGWGSSAERGERLGEALEIITGMFRGATMSFDGKHFTVRDLPNLPAPAQPGGPPVHIGGVGPKYTLPLVARYADVWNVPTYALGRIAGLSRALDAECEKAGRDPATIRRSVEAVLTIAPEERLDEAVRRARRHYGDPGYGMEEGGFTGTPRRIIDRIGELVEAGISSFVFFTHDRASAETLELFARDVAPHFSGPA